MRLHNYWQCVVLAAAITPASAFATMGGDTSSIQSNQLQLKSATHVVRHAIRFTDHEIQASSCTTIRESIAANGPVIPDLHQILEPSFSEFTAYQKNQPAGHTQLLVQQPSLVVHSTGHMRAFKGNAYLPTMLSHGVTANDIL